MISGPFLTKHATQLLVQALVISRLDYCNALLAGIPTCAIKPLQIIQSAATHLVFNQPKRAHVTLLLISLHWLPVVAQIKLKSLVLSYRTTMGSPMHLHPHRSLRSVNEQWTVIPLQRATKSVSRTFFHPVGGMTYLNSLGQPNPSQSSRNNWKLIHSVITASS